MSYPMPPRLTPTDWFIGNHDEDSKDRVRQYRSDALTAAVYLHGEAEE